MSRPLGLLLVLAAAIAGCSARESMVPVASGSDPRCPQARARSQARPELVVRAVRRDLAHIFSDVDTRRYRVELVGALATATFAPGYDKRPYTKVAARRCGRQTAKRSWIVDVQLPFAPAASFGRAIVFVAHTDDGWTPWYLWFPNADRRGAFIARRGS